MRRKPPAVPWVYDRVLTQRSNATLDRATLRLRYLNNRNRSAELFALVDPSAYYDRPIPLRHPVVFYEGHLPAFSFNKLGRAALANPRSIRRSSAYSNAASIRAMPRMRRNTSATPGPTRSRFKRSVLAATRRSYARSPRPI